MSGPATTNGNALYIGSWNANEEFFKGTIDEPAVYDSVLSATRIGVHYEAGSGKAPPPPSAPAAVLADAPVSYWRLGEASGTSAGDERGANPGTYQNSPTLGATSLLATDSANTAVSFDGTNDNVKVPSSSGLQLTSSISLEAWIKPSPLPSSGKFVSILTKAESYSLQFNGPQLEFTIIQSGVRKRVKAPEGAIATGQTYHVVGTYDGTTQRLYIDGALVASTALSGPATTNGYALYIGSWNANEEFFKGTIDEPAVYDSVLSATRIGVHYEAGSGKAPPSSPNTTITSLKPSYTSHEEPPITFTSDKSGSTFECSLDGAAYSTCSSPYTLPANLSNDPNVWHTFQVAATDSEGRQDLTPAEWTFNTAIYPPAPTTSKLVYPEDGKKTASYYTLKAEWGNSPWGGGVTGVSFQVKLPKWDAFQTVPAECVIDGKGEQVSWPLPAASNPGHSEPVFLKVKSCAPFEEAGYPREEIQFRAVFDGGQNAAGASEPAATEFIYGHNGKGASVGAVASVGPASLDLLTGAFTISRTDVSIPIPGSEANLEFTRVYHSGEYGPSFLLGPEWQPSTPAESEYEGEAWQMLAERFIPEIPAVYEKECWDEEGEPTGCGAGCDPEFCEEWLVEEAHPEERWMELLNNQGEAISFEISGGNYISPDYAKELKLAREDSKHLVLSDPNGTHTVFEEENYATYRPKTISFQATPNSARMVYEKREHEGLVLMREIAPAPPGVTCGDWTSIETKGCRTLKFEYKEGTPFYSWELRLDSIRYYNATGENSQVVAKYSYDKRARLIEEWDPRIEPNLKEKYAYYSELDFPYLLTSLTPPGEEPWKFGYKLELKGKHWEEELTSVSRASLIEGEPTATTTIAYEVPVSGEGAPYDLSPEAVAEWGQADYPVDATAIFPPSEVPSEPPSAYTQATVHYMDPDGNEVNTASPSPPGVEDAVISTSEVDTKGNTIHSLSPRARLEAMKAADTVARSKELDSHSTYNSDGTRMLESWGPLHKVRLESGETAEARAHTTIEYDVGAPELKEGEVAPNLPTKETSGAAITGKADADVQVSETKYDWNLRKPTETIVDPGEGSHLNLITKTVYNSSGQVIEERQPSNTAGGTAGTTKTEYFSAQEQTPTHECDNKPAWAGLPCVTYPAAAPSPTDSRPAMPWTWFTKYSSLDQSEEVQEKTNSVLKRTTTITYDSAGRPTKTKVTGEGTSVPAIEPTYDESTGRVTSQKFHCESPESCTGFDSQEVKTTYDKLGRPIEYKDADGNTSGVAYDLLGRPVIASDGKGTQTITYDEKTGLPTKLVDYAAGTFTATYNADGQMTEQVLPNGLAQQITYDPEGSPVALAYKKLTGCETGCTWLSFSRESSIAGQVLKQESTLSSQEYSYDKAGRLTLAKDTESGNCTTRAYAFDKDSNRLSKTTRAPKESGACDTTSTGTKQSYEYDTADRLIGEGVEYDGLGRITSLPSTYSGAGALTTSYYVNDLTRSQTQDALTNTYYLDAALRQRERVQSGSKSGTEIYHYAGGSDSPAWTRKDRPGHAASLRWGAASAPCRRAAAKSPSSSRICTATSSASQNPAPAPPN